MVGLGVGFDFPDAPVSRSVHRSNAKRAASFIPVFRVDVDDSLLVQEVSQKQSGGQSEAIRLKVSTDERPQLLVRVRAEMTRD